MEDGEGVIRRSSRYNSAHMLCIWAESLEDHCGVELFKYPGICAESLEDLCGIELFKYAEHMGGIEDLCGIELFKYPEHMGRITRRPLWSRVV